MKNLLLITIVSLLSFSIYGQSPELINYQAAVYDNDGNPISSQEVAVRFGILEGSVSGTLVYEEEHTGLTTSMQGVFNTQIGGGTNTGNGSQDTFSSIDWSSGNHFLKVEADAGQGYEVLGITQFVSVPYALYAKEAGNVGAAYSAGSGIEIDGSNVISNTGDADADATNELNSGASLSGTTLSITDAGGSVDVDLSSLQDGVVDGDADDTNELQEWSTLPGIPDDFGDGVDNVNDADYSTSNELNTAASLSGTTLSITDAGGAVTVDLSSLGGDTDWNESAGNVYRTSGYVGIGTASPTAALDVNGNVVVDGGVNVNGDVNVDSDVSANSYEYNSPKQYYLSLGGMSFRPGHDVANDWSSYYGNGTAYLTNESGSMQAPFYLPDGAVITNVRVYYEDDAAENISIYISRDFVSSGLSNLVDFTTSTNVDGVQNTDFPLSHIVNNNGAGYIARVYADWSSQNVGDELALWGIVITYQMNETY
jgi:hypothetical protein